MKLYQVFPKEFDRDRPVAVFAEDEADAAYIAEEAEHIHPDFPIDALEFPRGQKYVVAWARVESGLGPVIVRKHISPEMLTD